MNTTRFYLTICLAVLSFHIYAQDIPEAVQQLSQNYQQLLRDGAYEQAADYLHLSTSYVMHAEQWVNAQNAKVNEDMAMRTTKLDTDQQMISVKQVGDRAYYLFSIPEEIEVSLQRDGLGERSELLTEIMGGFVETYGVDQVRKIDVSRFSIRTNHQFMIIPRGIPTGKITENWKVVDFPDGQLQLAYGILPAGVWRAFFPNTILPDNMPYQQAVKQTVGQYFNLLMAKQYDGAATQTLTQQKTPTPFMEWYQSLDNDDSQLALWNYRITTPIQLSEQNGKRYAGMAIEWTLMLELTAEMASSELERSTQKLLEEMYPHAEITYSEEFQVFSWKAYTPAVASADPGKNNWKLLLEDETNGMSVNQNIDKVILRAIGID